MTTFHCEWAWVDDRCRPRVRIVEVAGIITAVEVDVPATAGDRGLAGLTLPGLANAHSHAFHRVLRGRTHEVGGDFWSWRTAMYAVAARLHPDTLRAIGVAVYAEMALAGITTVGEFHYVHHRPDGTSYDDPNAMGRALLDAAAEAGIRITLLDTIYLQAGVDGRPLEPEQRRFADVGFDRWRERTSALAVATPNARTGAAIHSVRAVDEQTMKAVADHARDEGWPLHVHLSEQPAENEECRAATGCTPAGLLARAGVLGPSTTAVHATHVSAADALALGTSGTAVCLCPTTERDLGDGVGPAAALAAAGSALCIGTDSHAVIDGFEEARSIELDERLVSGRRRIHPPAALLAAATTAGRAALGWPAGGIGVGGVADLTTVTLESPRLAGFDPAAAAAHVVFAATAADVRTVVVGGEVVVEDGRHLRVADVGGALSAAIGALT
jgi:formiminoglutamate deiminase